jgi:uncharacterized membrane protein YgcG
MWKRKNALDNPLLRLSRLDDWTRRHALMHLLVLGTTGSGKSSATVKQAMSAMLGDKEFGMLCCVAKPEDATAIKALCRKMGRARSVIEVTESDVEFNFLAWEMARTRNTNQVIDLLDHAVEIVRSSGAAPGRMGDEFWLSSKTAMLRATIPFIWAATGTVRIEDVIDFIRSAPNSLEQMQDPKWQQTSAFFRFCYMAAERLANGAVTGFNDEDAERAMSYWREIAALDDKTAGNIRITLTTALSRFQTGLLKRMFCGGTNAVPELLFHSAVLILNVPVQVFGEDGAIAQKIWKFCAQRVCLARNALDARQARTPVAITADEAHNFLYNDAEFLAQCRSAGVAVVFATQSIPTLRAKIGGENAHDRAEHLISNFNTVVLHSSACPVTNTWFASKLGRTLQTRSNYSANEGQNSNFGMNLGTGENWGWSTQSGGNTSSSSSGGSSSGSSWSSGSSGGGSDNQGRNRGNGSSHGQSWGESMVMDHMIEPGDFGRMLKTGGPENGNRVSAIWFQAGRTFRASGTNAMLVEFQQ